jgi:DNA-binding NarL/FixJ family response regulator
VGHLIPNVIFDENMKSKTNPKRVFIVDESGMAREYLSLFLNQERDFVVCGEADSVTLGRHGIDLEKPDVVLMDIALKHGSGYDLIKQVRNLLPQSVILVLSLQDENVCAERALEVGANGYVSKANGRAVLLEALRKVIDGDVYLSDELALRMAKQRFCKRKSSGVALDHLSAREFQVFQLLGRWLGTREIAGDLNLSIKTIEHYRESIKKKLGVANATDLVKLATSWSDRQGPLRPEAGRPSLPPDSIRPGRELDGEEMGSRDVAPGLPPQSAR